MTELTTAYLERVLKLARKYNLRRLSFNGLELDLEPPKPPEAEPEKRPFREPQTALDQLYRLHTGESE